jgi:hypothetical protein
MCDVPGTHASPVVPTPAPGTFALRSPPRTNPIGAAVLPIATIDNGVVSVKGLDYKCKYGCGAYGKSRCCPPHSPSSDETKKIIADFKIGLLIHFGGDVRVTNTISKCPGKTSQFVELNLDEKTGFNIYLVSATVNLPIARHYSIRQHPPIWQPVLVGNF